MKVSILRIDKYIFPVPFMLPLSFGKQSITVLDRLRICIHMVFSNDVSQTVVGWGEVPLNYPWFWPDMPEGDPNTILETIINELLNIWIQKGSIEHPLITGYDVLKHDLPELGRKLTEQLGFEVPELSIEVINSAFDLALYDAYGKLNNRPVYSLFDKDCLPVPIDSFFSDCPEVASSLKNVNITTLLNSPVPSRLKVWHMVGINDSIEKKKLESWLNSGGIKRIKIKLSGDNLDWDLQRLIEIGRRIEEFDIEAVSIDYNGPASECWWLIDFLDKIERKDMKLYRLIQYIEQPLKPGILGDLNQINKLTERKPLIVDEGAGSWQKLHQYYNAGWSGIALKICKSQTSSLLMAILSRISGKLCTVMDLTNPSLAQIAHVQLAAFLSDRRELESNSMQFCPEASIFEQKIHKGVFTRKDGFLDLNSIQGPGYGYRIDEIARPLPKAVTVTNKDYL
ncbi:MAG: mandelate racemase/muconate lactonizing enzyme family protein [Spirochaetaceae bacterium]|nr:mandelate racemase/muconate lactonizing enzyme family protein [Spirochaetaceae bacterium]